jgi:tRNA(Arg) A34 adenosine deaminase TadA
MSGWSELPPGLRAALVEQWAGIGARGLPCGAAVTDGSGTVVARGRNRAYDPVTGTDPLEGTPLAHAELNALARVSTGTEIGSLTVWCSQRPCAMCSAALAFTGFTDVRHLAEDPSPAAQGRAEFRRIDEPYWAAVSTVLFLYTGAVLRGVEDRNLGRHRKARPGLTALVLELAADDRLGLAARAGAELADAAEHIRERVVAVLSELP